MTFVSHPTRFGSVLSLGLAVVAVALVASGGDGGPGVSLGLAVGLVCLGTLAMASAAGVGGDDGYRSLEAVLLVVGVGLSLAGVGFGTLEAETLPLRIVLAAGLLGVSLLGAGLAPAPAVRPRHLVGVGTGVLVVAVVLAGLMTEVGSLSLLSAMAAVVVAWDAGENAVSLGEHVGRRARTWPVELGHTGASASYGTVVVAATFGVTELNVTDVPLTALLLLLGGAVALLVALSN
ncbi:hypothetical protein SAMN04488063_0255 [Halopelagius inordinatus]|uniref:Uncharacterized protein n=1 Tax=Halopelagius inordinatus TaxID=553467 RepID=A0A1I2LHD0_9EURY|nr:hypothetical protein [Halopelagius inordinatus]SFF77958.1 hypothetical protein SAMN04488063_0255 [Halopelagius inordinatus]